MYQETKLPSLGRQIFSVVKMEGPTAALFNVLKDDSTTKFKILRNEVQVYPSKSINTGLTQEVVQDIRSQFGKSAIRMVGTLLRGLSNEAENIKTLEFLEAKSKAEPTLTLTDETNSETTLFEITNKVNTLVLKANSKNMRTYEAFCVLPYSAGSSISALNKYVGGKNKDERGLFIAEVGQIKFYMNPDATSTKAYVGLKDSDNISKSSAVFGPYVSEIVEAQDPESGNMNYFIFNRFSITESPLHRTGNEMLFKFDIA